VLTFLAARTTAAAAFPIIPGFPNSAQVFSRVEPAVEIGWLYSIGGSLDLATSGWIDFGFQKLGKLHTPKKSGVSLSQGLPIQWLPKPEKATSMRCKSFVER